jgi:hypothetical protein
LLLNCWALQQQLLLLPPLLPSCWALQQGELLLLLLPLLHCH